MTEGLVGLIEREGPLRFDRYMQLALYHPTFGYYAGGKQRTGFGGHFVTSPELTPAFGALWVRAFEAAWRASGQPPEFTLTEVGAGEGGFAAAVTSFASGEFGSALRYRIVEPIAELRERQSRVVPHATWVRSIDELDAAPHGAFFANEVLDNLAVRVIEGAPDGPREVWVEARDGALTEDLRPAGGDAVGFLRQIGVDLEPGRRFEIPEASAAFVRAAAASVDVGAVFLVDYGDTTKRLRERSLGSLLCYSDTGVDDRPLDHPGEKDITVRANWNVVVGELIQAGWQVAAPTKQGAFLESLGAKELAAAYQAAHDEAIEQKRGADALRALAGRSSIATLLDDGGLGGLDVVAAFRSPAASEGPADTRP